MRIIAALLLIIFSLVQVGQVCCSLFTDTTAIFMADEEKVPEKMDAEKKAEKEHFLSFYNIEPYYSLRLNSILPPAVNIKRPPCLEMQTPPPDFC